MVQSTEEETLTPRKLADLTFSFSAGDHPSLISERILFIYEMMVLMVWAKLFP